MLLIDMSGLRYHLFGDPSVCSGLLMGYKNLYEGELLRCLTYEIGAIASA